MENRCRNCLLQEIDPQAYQQKIRELIDRMEPELRADSQLIRERLDVCRACSYLREGFCGACGCFIELRTASKKQICPYQKW
ncbi:MAG: DUF6171 family protein [bacterium]|nr:DUF6171 family protein [bacterium]